MLKAELAIFNASPLIALSNAGYPQIVRAAANRLLVPAGVVRELSRRGDGDPAVQLARSNAFAIIPDRTIPSEIESAQLGAGESSVLALGLANRGATLILDDFAARRCAKNLAMQVHGSLWLVTEAKSLTIIPAARPVFAELLRIGLYLPEQLVQTVLQEVGE